jgi:hypothetical protein
MSTPGTDDFAPIAGGRGRSGTKRPTRKYSGQRANIKMLPPDYPVMGRSAALLGIQDGKKRGVRAIDDLRELLMQQG